MNSEITDLIAALKDGSMSLDEVASAVPRTLLATNEESPSRPAIWRWQPPHKRTRILTFLAHSMRWQQLTDEVSSQRPEYRALADAVAESLRAEDQRKGDGHS